MTTFKAPRQKVVVKNIGEILIAASNFVVLAENEEGAPFAGMGYNLSKKDVLLLQYTDDPVQLTGFFVGGVFAFNKVDECEALDDF